MQTTSRAIGGQGAIPRCRRFVARVWWVSRLVCPAPASSQVGRWFWDAEHCNASFASMKVLSIQWIVTFSTLIWNSSWTRRTTHDICWRWADDLHQAEEFLEMSENLVAASWIALLASSSLSIDHGIVISLLWLKIAGYSTWNLGSMASPNLFINIYHPNKVHVLPTNFWPRGSEVVDHWTHDHKGRGRPRCSTPTL